MLRSYLQRHSIPLGLGGIWLVATAFNITKAITIDDTYYLKTAIAFAASPSTYLRFLVPHYGLWVPIYYFNQPHLLFWIDGLLIRIFGLNLLLLHAVMSLWALAATIGMYRLARMFTARALLITAAFILGPVFLPGQNLMTDVPLISVWIWFFVLLMSERKSDTKIEILLGLLMAAGMLIKYTSLVLIIIFVGSAVLKKQYRRLWAILWPVAAIVGWSLVTLQQYGQIHILTRPVQDSGIIPIALKLISWQTAIGATSLFFLSAWMGHKKFLFPSVLFGLVISVLFGIFFDHDSFNFFLRWLFTTAGLWVTLGVVQSLWKKTKSATGLERDRWIVLSVWFGAAMSFIILFAPFMAVRHLLLVMPIILIVFALTPLRRVATGALLGTIALGMMLAISDWQWSNVYRQQAPILAKQYQKSNTVWYLGNWGWQWYAGQAGMKPLTIRQTVRPGDIVIAPTVEPAVTQLLDNLNVSLVNVVVIPPTPWTTLRTMLPEPYVGYTGFRQRGLPYYITNTNIEAFRIYRVNTLAQTPN